MSHETPSSHRSLAASPLPRLTAEVLDRVARISAGEESGSANLPQVAGPAEARVLAAAGDCLELVCEGADELSFACALARLHATIEPTMRR